MNSHPPGRDAVAFEVDASGTVVVEWSDGTKTATVSTDLLVRIRAQGIATQSFLKKKRNRPWPLRI